MAHRARNAEILASGGNIEIKTKPKIAVKEVKEVKKEFRGYKPVYRLLKEKFNTRGERENIVDGLIGTGVGGTYTYKNITFTRVSPGKWVLY